MNFMRFTFNSIKDYHIYLRVDSDKPVKIFQFHQGLSEPPSFAGGRERQDTFNSIKDYLNQ